MNPITNNIIQFILDNNNRWQSTHISKIKKIYIKTEDAYNLDSSLTLKSLKNYITISDLKIEMHKQNKAINQISYSYYLKFEEDYVLNYFKHKEESPVVKEIIKIDELYILLNNDLIDKIINYILSNNINYRITNPKDKFADDVYLIDEIKELTNINIIATNLESVLNQYNLKWIDKDNILTISKEGYK